VTRAFGVTCCCTVERSGSPATRVFDLDASWWLVVSFTIGVRTAVFDYITCYIDPAVTACCWNSRCWRNKAVFFSCAWQHYVRLTAWLCWLRSCLRCTANCLFCYTARQESSEALVTVNTYENLTWRALRFHFKDQSAVAVRVVIAAYCRSQTILGCVIRMQGYLTLFMDLWFFNDTCGNLDHVVWDDGWIVNWKRHDEAGVACFKTSLHSNVVKVKGKVHLITGHEGRKGE